MDRGILVEVLRQRGIRDGLIEREKMLWKTKNRMRLGRELEESFWTARGIRQKCPLSPLLFNILMVDLEKEMGNGGGEVKLRDKKYNI